MMRSLWSAASGMIAQQTNVDTIANNLANVNTNGYKAEKAEFKSLLYQTLQTKTTTANGEQKPISAQVGLGTRVASITSKFTQGSLIAAESNTAFAIDGEGFFAVRGADGETYYTRNGNFGISMGLGNYVLTNSNGYPVLDTTGQAIEFPKRITSLDYPVNDEDGNPVTYDAELNTSKLLVYGDGSFYYQLDEKTIVDLDMQIGTYQFNNAAGLDKLSGSLYNVTDASGDAINEARNPDVKPSSIKQGYLENSNVQVADEMVSLIVAQRAYELNSKAIQATDDMLSQANNLRR